MNSHRSVDWFVQPRSIRLVSVVAMCLGAAMAGYAIAEMPTHLLKVPVETTAAVTRQAATPNSRAQVAAWHAPSATSESPLAASRYGLEGPRECALDKGISDACTFN